MLTPDARQKSFLFMAIKFKSVAEIPALLQKLPKKDAEVLLPLFDKLKAHDNSTLSSVAHTELKKMTRPKVRSFLSDVHNDWIVDLLLQESPEMISTVLRYLPAERVKMILDALPQETLIRLPKMSDTYRVPRSLIDVLRYRFENLFLIPKTLSAQEEFQFDHLCLLSSQNLQELFMELGYREIAIALQSLPEATRTIVTGRLSVADQKKVKFYQQSDAPKASDQRIKKAQGHLVGLDDNMKDPSLFVKELGFMILAKSILSRDYDDLAILKKKLSKTEVRELERMISQFSALNTEASVLEYRDDILTLVRRMLGN